MKAMLEVMEGKVKVYTDTSVNLLMGEATRLIEAQGTVVDPDAGAVPLPSRWAVGTASALGDWVRGTFKVTFEEAGEVEWYLECTDPFGKVVSCGEIGEPGSKTVKVEAGGSWEGRTTESNALTLASPR